MRELIRLNNQPKSNLWIKKKSLKHQHDKVMRLLLEFSPLDERGNGDQK